MFGKIFVRGFTVWWLTARAICLFVLSKLGLRYLYWIATGRSNQYQPLTGAAIWRDYFERLGPTYIKFGQIIASSPGLFPETLSHEFKKCLDRVPPFDLAEVQQIIVNELGKAPTELFREFNPVPIAAASIAQVHGAVLVDGTSVVVKVQRPRIADRIEADLWFMHLGARIMERVSIHARHANAVGIVEDFQQTLLCELDFLKEAANMDEFNTIMAKHHIDRVKAPRVHHELTTARVLTMERFYGFKADDIAEATRLGIDTEKNLRVGMRAWLLTVLLYGFFHGDVHAGNLMFLPQENQIGFLDFGIIGRFDNKQRELVVRYILAFAAEDWEEVAKTIIEMGSAPNSIDISAFAADLKRIYAPLLTTNLAAINYGAFLPEITRNAMKFGVKLPRDFILIIKQLLYFDRYAKLAAPKLNVFNDIYLVDFMFTPAAQQAGLDMNKIMALLIKIQSLQTRNPVNM
ncbi:MAG: AarF/ABC1/UbiB kinase family protein [Myxococcales bacterium]|nr:AarF/ABC1/UbiB kinase family protein [Myxococcales bacterium]